MKFKLILSYLVLPILSLKLNSNIVSNCPSTTNPKIDIKDFKIDLNSDTNTLSVNIDAQIKEIIETANAKLSFSLFGSELFSVPLNLCTSVSGNSVCPLQPGEFTQDYSPDLPSAVSGVADKIAKVPGSAISAKLDLTDASGQALGCVSVGLNNPTSAQQPAIIGVTALIAAFSALLALVSSASYLMLGLNAPSGNFQSRSGPTPSFFDVVSTFQFIAITGQLNLKYPDILQEFATNFGWSMGIINIPPLQRALNKMHGNPSLVRRGIESTTGLTRRALEGFLPSQNATSYSQLSGVASYSAKLHVSPNNYFMTVLVIFAILMGGVTVLVLLLRVLLELLSKMKPASFVTLRDQYANYYVGNLLRLFTLLYFFLATAALYQLTLDSDLTSKVIAGIVLGVFCILLMAVISYLIIRAGPARLYSEPKLNYRYGSLYSDFRQPVYAYFIVVLLSALSRAIAVGGLGNYPWIQLGVLTGTEIISFVILFLCRPHFTSLGNTFLIFIGVIRIANTGLLFFFIQSFFLPELARTILSIVIIVLQAIMVIAIVLMTLWGLCITIGRLIKGKNNVKDPETSVTEPLHRNQSYLGSHYLEQQENSAPLPYFRPSPSSQFSPDHQDHYLNSDPYRGLESARDSTEPPYSPDHIPLASPTNPDSHRSSTYRPPPSLPTPSRP